MVMLLEMMSWGVVLEMVLVRMLEVVLAFRACVVMCVCVFIHIDMMCLLNKRRVREMGIKFNDRQHSTNM